MPGAATMTVRLSVELSQFRKGGASRVPVVVHKHVSWPHEKLSLLEHSSPTTPDQAGLAEVDVEGEAPSKVSRGFHELPLAVARLNELTTPVQTFITNIPAAAIGLGHDAAANLQLRKRLGRPGAPFGGLGFFDPSDATTPDQATSALTASAVTEAKLTQFERCAQTQGQDSFYFWALQPIFNARNNAVAAEILVRAKNGSDSAPFEDLQALMDPGAPGDVKNVYAHWKASEIVDFSLKALLENPVLQGLASISSNLRPLDMDPESQMFLEVSRKLERLPPDHRELLLSILVLEITEDQKHPVAFAEHIEAWRALGFRIAADDAVAELAAGALGIQQQNFNVPSNLQHLMRSFWMVKVDLAWAGHLIFLSHPAVASRPALKKEILRLADEQDEIHIAAGPNLRKLDVKHSAILLEFATWAREMICKGKQICIELSVSLEDENCAWTLGQLRKLGLDIFGADQAHFWFQGGPCGAKAFTPEQFANSTQDLQHLG